MAYQITLSPGARTNIAKALEKKAAIVVRREAARIADTAVEECIKLARQELYTDRPASRRSRPGSLRYVNGFSAKVEGSTFPIRVSVTNRSKIAKLIENGSPAHQIGPRSKGLWTPDPPKPSDKHANAYGSSAYLLPRTVQAPALEGHKILERGLRAAFKKRGSAVRATK